MVEHVKTAVIFLLTLSMVALLAVSLTLGVNGETGIVASISGIFQLYGRKEAGEAQALIPEPAAFPGSLAVTGESGVYSAWADEDYARLYNAVSGVYSEALGSLDLPVAVTEQQYLELYAYPSIHLSFNADLPFYIHYAWTGSGSFEWENGGKTVRSVVIGQSGGAVALAFSTGDGEFFMAGTGTSVSRLESVCNSAAEEPNSFYAFQNPLFSNLAGDELVYDGVLGLPVYQISTPDYISAGELPRPVLEAFSMRHYLAGFFVSGTGAIQYAEGAMELTVGLGGELSYVSSSRENPIGAGLQGGSPAHQAQAVECARAIVTDIWTKTGSLGRLSLGTVEYDGENGTYYIGFEIMLGGYYVDIALCPAYVVIEDGCVSEVGVRPQIAVLSGQSAVPYAQLAAAAMRPDGGRAGVLYAHQGGSIYPVMAVVEDDG